MTLSSEQLISIARNYWSTTDEYYLQGEASPENKRLGALWEQEIKKLDQWWAFLEELEGALPEFTIGDATTTSDANFRCVAYWGEKPLRDFAVVGCVSIIAPVFIIYGLEFGVAKGRRTVRRVCFEPLPAEMQKPARIMADKIEKTFKVSALPRELAETPVPLFVERKEPPHTTLFHALFTHMPESVP